LVFFFAFASSGTIYSLYYRVIGNGNFNLEFATIDTSSSNGAVKFGNNYLLNVYASYTNLPHSYDRSNQIIYWIYSTNLFYQINCQSQSASLGYLIPNATLDVQFDSRTSRLYGLTTDNVNRNVGYIVNYNTNNLSDVTVVVQIPNFNVEYIGRGAIDTARQYYYILLTKSLTIIDLISNSVEGNLNIDAATCMSLIAIYSSNNNLYGVTSKTANRYGDLGVVLIDTRSGKCETIIDPIAYSGFYFDSAIDGAGNELSILTTSGLYVTNLSAKSYSLKTGVNAYNPEYFTGLSYS